MSIAVVGCGHWGKNLVRNFYELGSLSAVSDADFNLATAFAEQYDVSALSYEEILESDCKGIVIAAPATKHADLAIKGFESGKHVYVEKPLAMTLDEADMMIAASKKANRQLMVGHLLQYHPIFVEIRKKVEDGDLGRLKYIYSNRLSLGKIRSEEDVIWSFAPHDISMLLSLTKQKASSVYCVGTQALQANISDIATIHIEFDHGLRAHISTSWLHPVKEQKLVVIGENGMAVFDDTLEWSKKLSIYPHSIDQTMSPPLPNKAEPIHIDVPKGEPLREECKHFIKAIDGEIDVRTDGMEGRAVLSVLSAASKSLTCKEVIYV